MEEDSSHFVPQWMIRHGDLKPENLLIIDGQVKLADLGEALRVPEGAKRTRQGTCAQDSVTLTGEATVTDPKPSLSNRISQADHKLEAASLGFAIGYAAVSVFSSSTAFAFAGGALGLIFAIAFAIAWTTRKR